MVIYLSIFRVAVVVAFVAVTGRRSRIRYGYGNDDNVNTNHGCLQLLLLPPPPLLLLLLSTVVSTYCCCFAGWGLLWLLCC